MMMKRKKQRTIKVKMKMMMMNDEGVTDDEKDDDKPSDVSKHGLHSWEVTKTTTMKMMICMEGAAN